MIYGTLIDNIIIRTAIKSDLPRLIELYANDDLGATRELSEEGVSASYQQAFSDIECDPNAYLFVLDNQQTNDVIGTIQLNILANLTRHGMKRAQLEGIRIDERYRAQKLGREFIQWLLKFVKQQGCGMVQLNCDKQRERAKKFYLDLGFTASHEGMKLFLT